MLEKGTNTLCISKRVPHSLKIDNYSKQSRLYSNGPRDHIPSL